MRPHLRARMPGSTACVTRKHDFRFATITSSQSRSLISSIGCGREIPALFTRMSTAPTFSSLSRTSRSTSVAEDTSAWMLAHRRPNSPTRSATACASSARRRQFTTMSAPASASAKAMARPIPRLDPVTRATFPVSSSTDVRIHISGREPTAESRARPRPRDKFTPWPFPTSTATPRSLAAFARCSRVSTSRTP